ncbi:class I SAM-dependent methyltransferase [Extensimonas vulgaris]|uniref:Methyltransferase family protein n=1 Tax=Extensimonas vulgaris TaxID=1031594 RepID=A0A369ARY1_9BURK|nr:methyltransferase domain-containing protein [Extensimonas vulgaris]RCX11991.1 methyltransferase family protein [Extensimonas vulgaris]TWI38918.1 methyltransferase family protein [Extensimonas vulgaris]TXD14982.1 class I SAM-dependent methyltransferase [Extensimonas vulgaris]
MDALSSFDPAWFDSPAGRYLLAWEQARFDAAVADVFGYHSLQLGLPQLDGLRCNRMPHRWLALGQEGVAALAAHSLSGVRPALLADPAALPFAAQSLDLVLLPHTLERSIDPHTTLREVERVLVPEGRVIISGLHTLSLWGLRQMRSCWWERMGWGGRFVPGVAEFIAYRRLRDWLRLLSFEVESAQFGCYRPAVRGSQWLERLAWMDALGARAWPVLGAVYFIVAVKRVHGMRLLEPTWRAAPQRAAASMPVARLRGADAGPGGDRARGLHAARLDKEKH